MLHQSDNTMNQTSNISLAQARLEHVLRLGVELATAEFALEHEERRAMELYERLKDTKGTEIFQAIERHSDYGPLAEKLATTAGKEIVSIVYTFEVTRAGLSALPGKALAAVATALAIGYQGAATCTTVVRNLRSNWHSLARLRPASNHLINSNQRFNDAVGSAKGLGNPLIQFDSTGRMGRMRGQIMSGDRSDLGLVSIRYATAEGIRQLQTEVVDSRWAVSGQTELPVIAAYALAGDDNSWAVISDLYIPRVMVLSTDPIWPKAMVKHYKKRF